MQAKKKICAHCEKESYIYKTVGRDRYCKPCALQLFPSKTALSRSTKPIPVRSNKKVEEDREYSTLRLWYLERNPYCCARIPGTCLGGATDIHHKRGRGSFLLIVLTWLAVCRACHQWIEEHPKEAKELGFSESRHNN